MNIGLLKNKQPDINESRLTANQEPEVAHWSKRLNSADCQGCFGTEFP